MKKLILLTIGMLSLFAAKAMADAPVTVQTTPNSAFLVTYSTVSVSSQTATTVAAVSGYRALEMSNLNAGTTVYYTLGTSATAAVQTIGRPIFPNTTVTEDYNGNVRLKLAAGASAVDVRTIQKRKQ